MQKHKLKGWATISIALLLLVLLPKTYSLVSVLPLYVLITKGVHISIANGIFLSTMWIVYILTLLFPLYWLLDRFILIFVYLPIAIVFYKDTETAPDQLFLILETLFWDIPLLLWVQIISAIGGRALQVDHK